MQATLTWNQTRFNNALQKYLPLTSKSLTDALNTKGYYIARKAIWFTHKTNRASIEKDLGKYIRVLARVKSTGRFTSRRVLQLSKSERSNAPLAALIVQSRRGKAGKKGLYGSAMKKASIRLRGARLRSIAFLKSGWIPARNGLARLAKIDSAVAPNDPEARQRGRAKGRFTPAKAAAFVFKVILENLALAKRDKNDALAKWGGEGLQKAFNSEAQSMIAYIQKKMDPGNARFNADNK